jgi:hypothetical protein
MGGADGEPNQVPQLPRSAEQGGNGTVIVLTAAH